MRWSATSTSTSGDLAALDGSLQHPPRHSAPGVAEAGEERLGELGRAARLGGQVGDHRARDRVLHRSQAVLDERQRVAAQRAAVGGSSSAAAGRPARGPAGSSRPRCSPTWTTPTPSRGRSFGPVVSITPYADVDDAVRIANDS
jgi:acyl-CoA reductase-like NAD-dependent aldehyde dehydrogenase